MAPPPLPSPGLISSAFPEIYLERGSWAAFRAFQEAGGATRLAGEHTEEEEQQREEQGGEEEEEEHAIDTHHDGEHDEATNNIHPNTHLGFGLHFHGLVEVVFQHSGDADADVEVDVHADVRMEMEMGFV